MAIRSVPTTASHSAWWKVLLVAAVVAGATGAVVVGELATAGIFFLIRHVAANKELAGAAIVSKHSAAHVPVSLVHEYLPPPPPPPPTNPPPPQALPAATLMSARSAENEAEGKPQQAAVNLPMPPMLLTAGKGRSSGRARKLSAHGLSITTVSTTQVSSDIATSTTTSSSHQPPPAATPPQFGGTPSERDLGQPAAVLTDLHQPPAAPEPVVDTIDMTHTAAALMPPPASDAAVDEKMDFLQQQLDSIGLEKEILNGLVLLGNGDNERLQGGQAVVQMARSRVNGLEYAIKFFVSQTAFDVEHAMYGKGSGAQASGLAPFLPQDASYAVRVYAVFNQEMVRNIEANTDKAHLDAHGRPLPPCIVMERGESLDIWAERAQPDRSQAFTMMQQLALRMKDLHAVGYVHRDLKPGNVMWLPRENRWTVIDFGCAARTGEPARLGFSLAYAAPEVISAYRRGAQTMVAQEALDVWSLGVMAFELLTGESALRMHEGKNNVMDRIEGVNGKELPWEGASFMPANRRRLGVFKASVAMLLSRDPAKRPSMKKFCATCDRVLAGSTTMQA